MARNIAERILDMFSKEISGLGSAVRENARTRQLRLQSAKVSGIAVNVLRRKPVFIGPCPCWVQPHIPGQHLRGFGGGRGGSILGVLYLPDIRKYCVWPGGLANLHTIPCAIRSFSSRRRLRGGECVCMARCRLGLLRGKRKTPRTQNQALPSWS